MCERMRAEGKGERPAPSHTVQQRITSGVPVMGPRLRVLASRVALHLYACSPGASTTGGRGRENSRSWHPAAEAGWAQRQRPECIVTPEEKQRLANRRTGEKCDTGSVTPGAWRGAGTAISGLARGPPNQHERPAERPALHTMSRRTAERAQGGGTTRMGARIKGARARGLGLRW